MIPLRTSYKFPIIHSTQFQQFYDVYIRACSKQCANVRVSAYTDFREDQGESAGCAMRCLYGAGDGILPVPFEGFIRFEIPEAGQIQENAGLHFVFEYDGVEEDTSFKVGDILLNNVFHRPQFISLEYDGAVLPEFDLQNVETVSTKVSESGGTVSFAVPERGEQDYILLYNSLGTAEVFDETACCLFVPKTNYCLEEPISFTYRNAYFKYDVNTYMLEVLLYLEGDRPGIDMSRDYVTVMFQERRHGLNGMLSMPTDGARRYVKRIPGQYYLRMMQKYEELCPGEAFTISKNHKTDELKAPLPGTLFFIKASYLPEYVEVHTKNPKGLSVIHFTSQSPLVEMLEQELYRMQDMEHGLSLLHRFPKTPKRLLVSLVSQMLRTAYSFRVQELEEATGQRDSQSLADRIVAFIHRNLNANISMQMLVDEFHVSESHLSHSFKRYKNVSLQRYIYNAKISRAKQWLAENELTITEIAKNLNYSDIHAFSHSFKQMVGMSPMAYRKMHKGKS
ncbi:MAG: helix-turn-helix transcriptional regulator [Clostridia bacterium]|nr:helix-turn-helix transcriptional regulator [Clostridia bacterium]